jgi:hypothetical protein
MTPSYNHPPARPSNETPLLIPGFTPITGLTGQAAMMTLPTDAIVTGDPIDELNIPAKLASLIEKCWKTASVTNRQARSGLQIGAARNQPTGWRPQDIFAAKKLQERNAPYAKAVAPTDKKAEGLFADQQITPAGIANDWHLMKPLKRLSAFTFRGDGRGPADISAANGFFPPVTRTDEAYVESVIYPQFERYMKRRFQTDITKADFRTAFDAYKSGDRAGAPVVRAYFIWRALVEHEALNIPRMVVNEALKGYISTSRSVSVAYEFSMRKNGWVYLTRVKGGYLIPTAAEADWVGSYEREFELAHPGQLPWTEIFGFRKTRRPGDPSKAGDPKFVGPLYLRNGFRETYPAAYEKVIQAFTST